MPRPGMDPDAPSVCLPGHESAPGCEQKVEWVCVATVSSSQSAHVGTGVDRGEPACVSPVSRTIADRNRREERHQVAGRHRMCLPGTSHLHGSPLAQVFTSIRLPCPPSIHEPGRPRITPMSRIPASPSSRRGTAWNVESDRGIGLAGAMNELVEESGNAQLLPTHGQVPPSLRRG